MVVNYGLNKVRFTAPVPVGSRLRAAFKLLGVDDVAGGAKQLTVEVAIEAEGSPKPVCVAESLARHYRLLVLLDDIATVLDDVATMTKVAAKKTAGVLGADLAITKLGPPTISAAGTSTYTLVIVNYGPSSAGNVTVTDVMPA
eukprot:gene3591-4473_t